MADTSVPWLTADERRTWLGLLALIFELPAALDAQLQEIAELTTFDYLVLAMLSERDDRAIQLKDLAFLANGSLSRLSHVLTRLERRGLVERRPAPSGRRATVAVLTDAGLDLVASTAPRHVAGVRELVFDRLTGRQVAQLGAIAERLLPNRRRPPV